MLRDEANMWKNLINVLKDIRDELHENNKIEKENLEITKSIYELTKSNSNNSINTKREIYKNGYEYIYKMKPTDDQFNSKPVIDSFVDMILSPFDISTFNEDVVVKLEETCNTVGKRSFDSSVSLYSITVRGMPFYKFKTECSSRFPIEYIRFEIVEDGGASRWI